MVESFYDILERLHSKHVGHKKTLAEVRYIEQFKVYNNNYGIFVQPKEMRYCCLHR